MGPLEIQRETILQCLKAIREHTDHGNDFILVGGAGGILSGSFRTTSDLDLLLAANVDPIRFQEQILGIDGFTAPDGSLTFRGPISMTIDLLKNTVLEKTYEDIREHTFLDGGMALLNPDVALAIKLHCFHRRADDENGERKRKTDFQDITRLSTLMAKSEPRLVISDRVAGMFKIGHYHLLLVRLEASHDIIANLVAAGVKKMLCPWDEDTEDQREYFSYFAQPGACPLTCQLLDEEEA